MRVSRRPRYDDPGGVSLVGGDAFHIFPRSQQERAEEETARGLDVSEWLRGKLEEAVQEVGPEVRTTVYRLYDEQGTLLYVGVTNRGRQRVHEHSKAQPWWDRVASASFQHFPSRAGALKAEAEAIRGEKPRYNVVVPSPMPAVVPREPAKPLARHPRITPPDDAIAKTTVSGVEALRLLSRQTHRYFGMSGEDFLQAWRAGMIDQADPRLGYVINLLALLRE